jgi:hypothetical protein
MVEEILFLPPKKISTMARITMISMGLRIPNICQLRFAGGRADRAALGPDAG